MAEYIEREAVKERIHATKKGLFFNAGKTYIDFDIVSKAVLEAPTADVVEVVRCKDCEFSSNPTSVSRYDLYCNNYDVRFCEKDKKIVCGMHYCGYGAKMDGKGEGE